MIFWKGTRTPVVIPLKDGTYTQRNNFFITSPTHKDYGKHVGLSSQKKCVAPDYVTFLIKCYEEALEDCPYPAPLAREVMKIVRAYGDTQLHTVNQLSNILSKKGHKCIPVYEARNLDKTLGNKVLRDAMFKYMCMGYETAEELKEVVPELANTSLTSIILLMVWMRRQGNITSDFIIKLKP